MTTLRQAAQQALEVLENSRSLEPVDVDWVKGKRKAVIATLRAALAEEALQRLTDVSQEIEVALAESDDEQAKYDPFAPVLYAGNGNPEINRQNKNTMTVLPPIGCSTTNKAVLPRTDVYEAIVEFLK